MKTEQPTSCYRISLGNLRITDEPPPKTDHKRYIKFACPRCGTNDAVDRRIHARNPRPLICQGCSNDDDDRRWHGMTEAEHRRRLANRRRVNGLVKLYDNDKALRILGRTKVKLVPLPETKNDDLPF